MMKEKDWLCELAEERSATDPRFAELNRRAEMVLDLILARRALGLTQDDIAQRMGVNRVQVAIIESKPTKVSLDKIAAYAEALGGRLTLTLPKKQKRRAGHVEPLASANG
jgi:transcriptional regulator with XRE-family HTH domain